MDRSDSAYGIGQGGVTGARSRCYDTAAQEHFPAKWEPVGREKVLKTKNLDLHSDSGESEYRSRESGIWLRLTGATGTHG